MAIETEIEAHVAPIEEAYREIITGPNARIEGGSRLWTQFQDAVAAWRAKPLPKRVLAIIERVCVGKIAATDRGQRSCPSQWAFVAR
jgi:hypothetical protein